MAEENKENLREFLKWVIALQNAMENVTKNGGQNNIWNYSGYKVFARKFEQLAVDINKHIHFPPFIEIYDAGKLPGIGDTVHMQQREIFEGVYANVSLLRSFLEGKIGLIADQTMAIRDFLKGRLRSAVFRPPEREQEVQDAVEQLLIGRGLQKGQEYDREVGRVKISAKEVIPDFVFPNLSLALEIKLIKAQGRIREVIDEINADIAAYSKVYKSILFIIYDLGFVRDEIEFRHDLEKHLNVDVVLIKN